MTGEQPCVSVVTCVDITWVRRRTLASSIRSEGVLTPRGHPAGVPPLLLGADRVEQEPRSEFVQVHRANLAQYEVDFSLQDRYRFLHPRQPARGGTVQSGPASQHEVGAQAERGDDVGA